MPPPLLTTTPYTELFRLGRNQKTKTLAKTITTKHLLLCHLSWRLHYLAAYIYIHFKYFFMLASLALYGLAYRGHCLRLNTLNIRRIVCYTNLSVSQPSHYNDCTFTGECTRYYRLTDISQLHQSTIL